MRLVEQAAPKGDPDPKARACYGVVRRPPDQPERVWLRCVARRPLSAVTEQFLAWCCGKLQETGTRVWVLLWDNASWHGSKRGRAWIRAHHQQVKHQGRGLRILLCFLPGKRPWLNPMEPWWVPGKRAIVEPARLLSAQEVAARLCAYFACSHEPHLTILDKVA